MSMYSRTSPSPERRDTYGRLTRVGYILRRNGYERHCSVVSRVCLVRGGGQGETTAAVTSSRDGTLKCWDIPAETHGGASSSTAPPPRLRSTFEEHSAWVNDAVVLPSSSMSTDALKDSRRIVSASNDSFLKVWRVDEEKQVVGVNSSLHTLPFHHDYVTCLAYAPQRGVLMSAGLDSDVVVTDFEAATRVQHFSDNDDTCLYGSSGRQNTHHRNYPSSQYRCVVGSFHGDGHYSPTVLAGSGSRPSRDRDGSGRDSGSSGGTTGASVWSVATMRNATLLVCGTASCVVRGWDPRVGAKLWRLCGHTENVRALMLSDDGTICISGSADHTVRLWDIGMRRCTKTFNAHTDSVWSLTAPGCSCGYITRSGGADAAAGGGLEQVYSSGRDGCVFAHDLRTMATTLVTCESSAVQAIAVPSDASCVWVATADSHVRRRQLPSATVASHSLANDGIVIPGIPRITEYKVLHNKRQILVRDAMEQLALWDVASGQCVDVHAPPAPASVLAGSKDNAMKRVLAQINKPVSVPTWFSCDVALGGLSVYLDLCQCFKAESEDVEAITLESLNGSGSHAIASSRRNDAVPASPPVNLGVRTLRMLFEHWVHALPNGNVDCARGHSTQGSPRGHEPLTAVASRPRSGQSRAFIAPPNLREHSGVVDRAKSHESLGMGSEEPNSEKEKSGAILSSSFPLSTGIVFSSRNGKPTYCGRLFSGLFSGVESPDLLPPWLVDVVWNQKAPPEEFCAEKALMFTFTPFPTEVALPSLHTQYCMAPPRTRVHRLMNYLVRALDFDWFAPTKSPTQQRRPARAVSFAARLGRCCTVPVYCGRQGEDTESEEGESEDTLSGSSSRWHSSGRRSRSSSVGRSSGGNGQGNSISGPRGRSFGLRRAEDRAEEEPPPANLRVHIDCSPTHASRRSSSRGSVPQFSQSGEEMRDAATTQNECFVEILCNEIVIDPEWSLATVRDFVWGKTHPELVLQYRRARVMLQPPTPMAPLPIATGPNSSSAPSGTNNSNNVGNRGNCNGSSGVPVVSSATDLGEAEIHSEEDVATIPSRQSAVASRGQSCDTGQGSGSVGPDTSATEGVAV